MVHHYALDIKLIRSDHDAEIEAAILAGCETVVEIVRHTGLGDSATRYALGGMELRGLVVGERKDRTMHYRLANAGVFMLQRCWTGVIHNEIGG